MNYECFEKVAIRKNDYKLCEKIPTPKTLSMPWEGRNHCYQMIAVNTNDPSICENIENLEGEEDYDRNYCKAIASRDISFCDKIVIEDLKKYCNRNLLMDTTAKTGDVSICEELGVEHIGYKLSCLTKVALFSGDESICDSIPANEVLANKVAHIECKAMVRGDPTVCETLESVVNKDNCFNKVAFVKQDISICDKIERSHIKIGSSIDAGCVEHIFFNIPFNCVNCNDLRIEIYRS